MTKRARKPEARAPFCPQPSQALGALDERLSPDVEVPARRLGRAIADRVLVYAKEKGWLALPGQGVAEASAPKSNADNAPESAPESGVERPGT